MRSERLLGVANLPERSQPYLHKEPDQHPIEFELSEEDIWEMASFHAASTAHANLYAAAAKTQQAIQFSRKKHLMPRSSSTAALRSPPQVHGPAASAPMEVPAVALAAVKAAAASACTARSLIMVREKVGDGELRASRGEEDAPQYAITPPHLITSRQHLNSHMVSSVVEGAGRTLKGRDLRNVRNAVWKQTGFFG